MSGEGNYYQYQNFRNSNNYNRGDGQYGGGWSNSSGGVGLRNLGNTCFLNSGLQCYASLVALNKFLMIDFNEQNDCSTSDRNADAVEVLRAFREFLLRSSLDGGTVYSPAALKRCMGKLVERFDGYSQQDALDLMTTLLAHLVDGSNKSATTRFEEEDPAYYTWPEEKRFEFSLTRFKTRYFSPFIDMFYGFQRNGTRCLGCGAQKMRFQSYSFVSVPVRRDLVFRVVVFNADYPFLVQDEEFRQDRRGNMAHGTCTLELVLEHGTELRKRDLMNNVLQQNKISMEHLDAETGGELMVFRFGSLYNVEDDEKLTDRCTYVLIPKVMRHVTLRKFIVSVNNVGSYERSYAVHYCHEQDQPMRDEAIVEKLLFGALDGIFVTVMKQSKQIHRYRMEDGHLVSTNSDEDSETIIRIRPNEGNDRFPFESVHITRVDLSQSTTPRNTLTACIEEFCRPSPLEKGSEWRCEKCQNNQCEFSNSFHTLPSVLLFHLRRFEAGDTPGEMLKVDQKICYDEHVNMKKFMPENYPEESCSYRLVGVACHLGFSLNSGHYNAFCRNVFNEKWYSCDDSSVHPVDPERVLNHQDAILLLYERQDDTMKMQRDRLIKWKEENDQYQDSRRSHKSNSPRDHHMGHYYNA